MKVVLAFSFFSSVVSLESNKICRAGESMKPHQNGLWTDNFPDSGCEDCVALCNGDISTNDDGEICVDGRVTYKQIQEFTGKPTYAPTSNTISNTGHFIAGDAYTMLGDAFYFIYDLVSSYTVNGTTYDADASMVDNVLVASKGTIENICYKTDFVRDETEYIEVSHATFLPGSADTGVLDSASVIFVTAMGLTGEFYNKVDGPNVLTPLSNFRLNLQYFLASFPTPAITLQYVPIYAFIGILRALVLGSGVVSTDVHPQPLRAPDVLVEDIQIDCEWDVLMKIIDKGVFDSYPLFSGGIIRRISIMDGGNACWNSTTAAMDITIPQGRADEIDDFVVNTLYPAIKEEGGDVALHLGKRIPNDSTELMDDVLAFYATCGMTVPESKPDPCYHPMCSRTNTPTTFEYPSEFFDVLSTKD